MARFISNINTRRPEAIKHGEELVDWLEDAGHDCLLDFESAQSLKESLLQIEKYQIKNTVVSSTISNVDVFGFIKLKDRSFVNYFKIIDGSIIQSHTAEAKIKLQESNEDILIH